MKDKQQLIIEATAGDFSTAVAVTYGRFKNETYSQKEKSHESVTSDCRKTVFRNQARHGFMSVLFNIWNKMEKKA